MKKIRILYEAQEPFHFNNDERNRLRQVLRNLKIDATGFFEDAEKAITTFLGQKIAHNKSRLPTTSELRTTLQSLAARSRKLANSLESLDTYTEYHAATIAIFLYSNDDPDPLIATIIDQLNMLSNALQSYLALKPGDLSRLCGLNLDDIREKVRSSSTLSSQEGMCMMIENEIERTTTTAGPPRKNVEANLISNLAHLYLKHFKKKPGYDNNSLFTKFIKEVFRCHRIRDCTHPSNRLRLIRRVLADM